MTICENSINNQTTGVEDRTKDRQTEGETGTECHGQIG